MFSKRQIIFSITLMILLVSIISESKGNYGKRKMNLKVIMKKAPCHLKSLDDCMKSVQMFAARRDNSTVYQSEEQEFNMMCKTVELVIKCTDKFFRKCAHPIHRQAYEIGKQQFVQSWGALCGPGPLRQNYIKHSPCVNQVKQDPDYKKVCVNNLQAALEKTGNLTNINEALNIGCCAFNGWEDCINGYVENKCGIEAKESVTNFIEMASGSTIHSVCNRMSFDPNSQLCIQSLPPNGTLAKGERQSETFSTKMLTYLYPK